MVRQSLPVEKRCMENTAKRGSRCTQVLAAMTLRGVSGGQSPDGCSKRRWTLTRFHSTCPQPEHFGRVAVPLQCAGHKRRRAPYDMMIAAVAHDQHLYTRNTEDFVGVDDLCVSRCGTS